MLEITILSNILTLLIVYINYFTFSYGLIKSWTLYDTLPCGISGAMTAYNETSHTITILSPKTPYGHAFMDFAIDTATFSKNNYPDLFKAVIASQMTNDFVTIEHMIYFVDILRNNLNVFNINTQSFISLNWTLPRSTEYSQKPCLTKSNDNEYLFILGGADRSSYVNTFYVYDITNNTSKGQGPALPFASSNFGCIVHSHQHLYVIGGQYIPNISLSDSIYPTMESYQIWSIYVADIQDIVSKSVQWTSSNNTLSYAPQHPYIAQVNDVIYIIGGWDTIHRKCSNETNYMLFRNTSAPRFDIVSGPLLPKSLCYAAGIVVDYDIYMFGGQIVEDGFSKVIQPTIWLKSNDAIVPTLSPTKSTQHPTVSPTLSPTQSPTHSPSNPPTLSPTNTTQAPTKRVVLNKSHTIDYWIFMGLLFGICILMLFTAGLCLYKRFQGATAYSTTYRFIGDDHRMIQ